MLGPTRFALAAALLASFVARRAFGSPSGDELVRQARAHEEAREDDIAARRYMEALSLDPDNEDAWLGLGALRVRIGEPQEAERVYGAALHRLPTMWRALAGRARARWAAGQHGDAEADLSSYAARTGDADAWRELADWYAIDGRAPAQLAAWRRLLALAQDESAQKEAHRMVRALVILVDGADPASSPADPDATRRGLAAIARRGGPLAPLVAASAAYRP